MISIYALCDERGRIRYIGQAKNPQARLCGHWKGRNGSDNNRRNVWLRSLDHKPVMRVLVVVEDREAMRTERLAIRDARKAFGSKQILNTISPHKSENWRPAMSDPDFRSRRSAAAKARWANPDYREMHIAAIQAFSRTPEFRSTMSKAVRASRQRDPGISARMSAAKIGNRNSTGKRKPETRKRNSEELKKRWADPEYRRKQTERMLGNKHGARPMSQETKDKIGTATKANWDDPEYQEKMASRKARKPLSPEEREAVRARMKARWADPEKRTKLIAAIKAGKERSQDQPPPS